MADDDVLSDDEIEALLDEEDDDESSAPGGGDSDGLDMEKIRNVYEEIADTVENILATILDREVSSRLIECAVLEPGKLEDALAEEQRWVIVSSELSGAVSGTTRYVLPEQDALLMADVMMGQDGDEPPEELDDVYSSAIVEMYNQMANSLATKLNELTGENIELEPPESEVVSTADFQESLSEDKFLWVEYSLSVEDLFESGSFFEMQPLAVAEKLGAPDEEEQAEAAPEPEKKEAGGESKAASTEGKEVKSVDFPQFEATESEDSVGNINLLMDVPMEVSVELGRTTLQVKEILNLGAGSIIELDRLAGEPVDLLINGRLVARGEVVVIDENFGVRVTTIVSPMERIK